MDGARETILSFSFFSTGFCCEVLHENIVSKRIEARKKFRISFFIRIEFKNAVQGYRNGIALMKNYFRYCIY